MSRHRSRPRTAMVAVVACLGACVAAGLGFTRHERPVPLTTVRAQPDPASQALPLGTVHFAPNAPQLSSIEVQAAEQVVLPVSEPLSGRVAYDESHTSRISSPVAGRVTRLNAEVGDVVPAGKILATLDAPDLGAAQADVQKARADEIRKRRGFDRAKLLFEAEVIAGKDYEGAVADLQQASAETRRAVARLKNLHAAPVATQDGLFALRTSVAGVVTERQLNPGQEVRPDLPAPLYVISDLDRVWVIVDAPEGVAAKLHQGMRIIVASDAYPQEQFAGTIDKVAPVLDPTTRRVQVRCSVRNADHKLRPEMYARVSVLPDTDQRAVLALPNSSLYAEGLATFVFVETSSGTFIKRRVSVVRTAGERTYIADGVRAGERVVTEGAFLLGTEVAGDAG